MTTLQTTWQIAFNIGIDLFGGVRGLGRQTGVSPSTVSRIARGEAPSPETAQKLGPIIGVCPCCGQNWPEGKDQ